MGVESFSIVLAHGEESSRDELQRMIEELGHQVPLATDSGRELVDRVCDLGADMLISGVELSDMDGVHALIECGKKEPLAAIVIARTADLEEIELALKDHVMAYLVEPVTKHDLKATIYLVQQRFEEFSELRQENAELRTALEARKWTERAKGRIMGELGQTEDEAFRTLRRMANDRRIKLVDMARRVIDAETLESP